VRTALVLDALGHSPAQLLDVARQFIAQSLEFLETEQTWAVESLAPGGGQDVGKPVGHHRRQVALKSRDLRPQRTPRGTLIDLGACG
jgi:hypothetical protein